VRDMVEEVVRDDDIASRAAFTAPGTADPPRAVPDEPVARRYRRRRSAAALPSHLEPAEVPDDSYGRVEYISVEMPEVLDEQSVTNLPPLETIPTMTAKPTAVEAWLAVVALGVVLVALFALGMALTR
jgi:hypothetical protein